jgi:hypothetical protein
VSSFLSQDCKKVTYKRRPRGVKEGVKERERENEGE